MVNYSDNLIGFIVREPGIQLSEWLELAARDERLQKCDAKLGINPFSGQPVFFQNNNHAFLVNDVAIGLVVWEEAQCLGVAGDPVVLQDLIASLCAALGGTYEPLET